MKERKGKNRLPTYTRKLEREHHSQHTHKHTLTTNITERAVVPLTLTNTLTDGHQDITSTHFRPPPLQPLHQAPPLPPSGTISDLAGQLGTHRTACLPPTLISICHDTTPQLYIPSSLTLLPPSPCWPYLVLLLFLYLVLLLSLSLASVSAPPCPMSCLKHLLTPPDTPMRMMDL